MQTTAAQIARMMDLSAVRTDVTLEEVERLAAVAKRFQCICVFVMPCYVKMLQSLLKDQHDIHIGGVVGFPSGAATTSIKVAETRQYVALGIDEIDMVLNVGWLMSGHDEMVKQDIEAVVEAAAGIPLKVILECHYLTDEQMRRGAELVAESGATFVKTGTGWAPTGATLENVKLLKETVGDRVEVKAAGGVRDLETVVEMIRRGVTRFGVGAVSGAKILEECEQLPGGIVEI